MHLTSEEFFTRLQDLFAKKNEKGKGSVFLKQKRLSHPSNPSPSEPLADLNPSTPCPVLIRASGGHSKYHPNERIQIATVVQPGDLDAFFARYAEVCRAGMMGAMKKRRKEKKKKGKKKVKEGKRDARR